LITNKSLDINVRTSIVIVRIVIRIYISTFIRIDVLPRIIVKRRIFVMSMLIVFPFMVASALAAVGLIAMLVAGVKNMSEV